MQHLLLSNYKNYVKLIFKGAVLEMDNNRKTLTAKEAAEHLGISYWLILEMVKRKEIASIKLGNRVVFRAETLDLWLENKEKESLIFETSMLDNSYGVLRKISD